MTNIVNNIYQIPLTNKRLLNALHIQLYITHVHTHTCAKYAYAYRRIIKLKCSRVLRYLYIYQQARGLDSICGAWP